MGRKRKIKLKKDLVKENERLVKELEGANKFCQWSLMYCIGSTVAAVLLIMQMLGI